MRRVIDDTHYEEVKKAITDVLFKIPADKVSEYSYGTYRSEGYLIKKYIFSRVPNIKFGKDMNTTGIGNNSCYEIIYTDFDKEEEHICGLIHLTDNMFGSTICWVSDYDGERKGMTRKITGCDPKSEFDMRTKRYSF